MTAAASEIADYLIAEGLVPAAIAAQLATQLAPAPAAAAVIAVEVRWGAARWCGALGAATVLVYSLPR